MIVISGMHRSGTSAVARVVNLLGVDLGAEDRMMAPKPDNPTGFWEHASLSAFNDDLLGFLGGRWDDPPVLLSGWEQDDALEPWREKAEALLEGQFEGDIAGWKDPRMSLLLPFWRTVVNIEPGVLVVRSPSEVAGSLEARDGMDREQAARLWLRYIVAARRNDPEALVVDYAGLLGDPEATADRIAAHLELDLPGTDVRAAISDFLDRGLRHHDDKPVEPATGALALAEIAYAAVTAGNDESLIEALAASIDAVHLADSVAQLEAAVPRLEAHRDDLVRERDIAVAQRDELLDERTGLRSRVDELRAALDTAAERIGIKSGEMGRLESSNARLGADLRAAQTRIAELESALASAQAELEAATRSPVARVKAWISDATG